MDKDFIVPVRWTYQELTHVVPKRKMNTMIILMNFSSMQARGQDDFYKNRRLIWRKDFYLKPNDGLPDKGF